MKTDLSKIIPRPWLIPEVIDFLDRYLRTIKNPKILEFGSGCSTAFFSQYLGEHGKLFSIEHNEGWFEHVQAYLLENKLEFQVDLKLIKNDYSQFCANFSANYFDLVFIDAKDRMACLQASREIVKPGGIVMLDDSQMRAKYLVAHQIMADWASTNELTGFKSNPLNLTEPDQFSATAWWVKPLV